MGRWNMSKFKKLKNIKSTLYVRREHEGNLLASPFTRIAHIEFTSRCNLRCVYCAASQPDYKGVDLDAETIESFIEPFKNRKLESLCVSAHGETTIYKDWHLYCNKMIDAGLPLHIISNFAREFSDEELHTLSRFTSIAVSCDTSDPGLYKKLCRGGDLGTLCLNITRIRGIVLKEGRRLPSISFSCVVSDRNVLGLPEYAAFARNLGIVHIDFCNLKKYPDLENTQTPNHVTEMPVEMLSQAEASLNKAVEFLRSSNISYLFQPGLLEPLIEKIQEAGSVHCLDDSDVKNTEADEINIQNAPGQGEPVEIEPVKEAIDQLPFASTRKETQTRDCLEPWQFLMIYANKDIGPCCWHQPTHSLGIKQSLSEAFNNTRIKELRTRLLTGDLPADCLNCPAKSWTTTDDLKKKVWNYLNPGIINKLLFHKIPEIEPEVLMPLDVSYEKGWYNPEIDLNIEEIDWQRWRWTAKRALCLVENPKKKALLIIRGSVDKEKYEDQKVIIRINDEILDEFVPYHAKFFREYIIKREMMAENDKIHLIIETDKVFVPSELNREIKDDRLLGIQVYHLFFAKNRYDR